MNQDALRIETDSSKNRIRVIGALDLYRFREAKAQIAKALAACKGDSVIDVSGVTRLDSAGALLLRGLIEQGQGMRHAVKIDHMSAEQARLYDMVAQARLEKLPAHKPHAAWVMMLVQLGEATLKTWHASLEIITFIGQACIALAKALAHPARLRFGFITRHIEEAGIQAIPIISLIAFLMSIIRAYQGLEQLKPLGAQQYTVNLVAISVLREMGVLLTAIMVAGRSGSAFTAEIGVMEVREEVDALKTLGFDPFEVLVVPRILGLLIALPFLTFIADMMGLLGGGLISLSLMDLSLPEYLERVRHVATGKDFFVGMIKAPVFAFVIALIGCMQGLKVSGSAESVGRETTASVVKSIFLVLMLDGLFSIYFSKVGL